jgi:hypothetical protein
MIPGLTGRHLNLLNFLNGLVELFIELTIIYFGDIKMKFEVNLP